MTDPRIIIAVLCGLVVGLVLVLAIVVAAYRRALAGRYAVIEVLARERDEAKALWRCAYERADRIRAQLDAANARLAPFIAKRERDEGGRFVRSEAA